MPSPLVLVRLASALLPLLLLSLPSRCKVFFKQLWHFSRPIGLAFGCVDALGFENMT
jgi:hypothetical protein